LHEEIDEAEHVWNRFSVRQEPVVPRPRWSPAWLSAACAMAVLLVSTLWWAFMLPQSTEYRTAKGEQRQVTLADGSSVTLNTDTTMRVELSKTKRRIQLERGEAWFSVFHDEQRPFTVEVANGVVQDIGTEFIINRTAEYVDVSVMEGIVEVGLSDTSNRRPTGQPAVLRHGERVSYGRDGHMSPIGLFNQLTAGAWKDGQLIFQATPLQEVLREVSRYRTEDIRLLDQSLANIPVSGVFNIQDLSNFMQTLQDALPVRATWVNPSLVIVERVAASTASR